MSTSTKPEVSDRVVRLPEFRQRLGGVSTAAIYEAMKKGTLPQNVRILGSRAVGWRESDIAAYIASLGK